MNSRAFTFFILILLACTAVFTGCNSGAEQQSVQRPNIIFIMSDDHAYQAISAYGGPLAELAPTPNIDRIAAQGMRFNRCMVTNSICGPSRATILSGKYSHLNGFVDNTMGSRFDFSQQTFTKVLQQAGYQTAVIGKLHLGGNPTGFDYFDILPGQGSYYNPTFINDSGQYQMEGYTTEIIADKTIEWLDGVKGGDQPWMVMMQHKAPHRAWDPGPNELGMYAEVTFPEPPTLFDDYSGRGTAASLNNMTIASTMRLEQDLKMSDQPRRGLNEEQLVKWNAVYGPVYDFFKASGLTGDDLVRFKYQRYMKDYLECVAAVDKSVGKVLDYLEENGLMENTMVVYTSDQGFYLGEHGWFDKRWMYKESLRTPLLVMWPGQVEAGSVNNDLVSNLDFGETFLEMAGAEIPDEMQGRSLLPILEGNTPADWRTGHYYHYYEHPSEHNVMRHYGITTERYKLIHFYYDIDEWELYDLEKDPMEMENVYNDPAYSEIKDDLHQQLEALRVQYGDNDSLNQHFIEEYKEKVKANPMIEYWKVSREDMQRFFNQRAQEEAESEEQ
jgi:arylsulfatase A-like enzyme